PGWPRLTERFDLSKPVVARVDGYALGGGFELALACDLIVASDRAVFALPEPWLGLVPGGRWGVSAEPAGAVEGGHGLPADRPPLGCTDRARLGAGQPGGAPAGPGPVRRRMGRRPAELRSAGGTGDQAGGDAVARPASGAGVRGAGQLGGATPVEPRCRGGPAGLRREARAGLAVPLRRSARYDGS